MVERRENGGKAPVTKTIDITYANLPARTRRWASPLFIGFCFVGCGLVACRQAPARCATLLALVGICLSSAFLAGPYISSFFGRILAGSIQGW